MYKSLTSRQIRNMQPAIPTQIVNSYEDEDDDWGVSWYENHVYFYADVTKKTCFHLKDYLDRVESNIMTESKKRDTEPVPIWLHLQTDGGDAFAALSVLDFIQAMRVPVYSVIEGVSASAGTVISVACSKRYITPSSFMMIHQVAGFVGHATYEEVKAEAAIQEGIMDHMIDLYANRSTIPREKVAEMLKKDYWISAPKALEYGLVDEVLKKNI